MKNSEWRAEVKRVGKFLGLDAEQTHELVLWSVEMAFDKLEKAQEHFTGEGY